MELKISSAYDNKAALSMKVKHCQSFDVLVLKSPSLKKTRHQKKKPQRVTIKTAPQVPTSNLTCSIDSPDNALKETLFALNNIKMPTAIYNPIPTFYTLFY